MLRLDARPRPRRRLCSEDQFETESFRGSFSSFAANCSGMRSNSHSPQRAIVRRGSGPCDLTGSDTVIGGTRSILPGFRMDTLQQSATAHESLRSEAQTLAGSAPRFQHRGGVSQRLCLPDRPPAQRLLPMVAKGGRLTQPQRELSTPGTKAVRGEPDLLLPNALLTAGRSCIRSRNSLTRGVARSFTTSGASSGSG